MKRNQKQPKDAAPVIAAEEEDGQQNTTKSTSIATTTAISTNRHAFRVKHTHKVGGRKTDLQLFRPSTTTSFTPGEAVTFEVEVRNPAAKPFDPSRTRVIFMDNGYFEETSVALSELNEALALAVAPGQAITLTMIVEPKRARMTLKDVKGECEVRVVSEGEEGAAAVLSQVFVFQAMDFAGDLTPLSSPASTLNVYIMGGSQTGKTTFSETLRRVLLPAAAAEEHTKQTLTPTQTLECIELPALQARFFDMWGTSTTTTAAVTATHDEQLLACILRGEVPLGFSPSTHISEEERATLQSSKAERAAHAVLFFVAADDVETNPTKMEALKATFKQIKNSLGGGDGQTHMHTHTPLVVITRVDLVEPPIASDPAKVAQLRRRVSQFFGVSWSNTLVFVPYAAPHTHTHTHTHTHKHKGMATATSSSRSLRSLMSKKSTSNVQQEGEKEGRGGNRSFDIDRLVLLIAKTALEAAREKVEGGCVVVGGEEERVKKERKGVGISMNKEKMRRLATVELEMDGSFSSNFRGRIASPV